MTQYRLVIDVESMWTAEQTAKMVGEVIQLMPTVDLVGCYYRPYEDEDEEPEYSRPEPIKSGWSEWITVGLLIVGIALTVSMAFG